MLAGEPAEAQDEKLQSTRCIRWILRQTPKLLRDENHVADPRDPLNAFGRPKPHMLYKSLIAAFVVSSGDALRIDDSGRQARRHQRRRRAASLVPSPPSPS